MIKQILTTYFKNCTGLDEDGHYSTAYDMAILMRYALKNETFSSIIATKNYTAKTRCKTYTWKKFRNEQMRKKKTKEDNGFQQLLEAEIQKLKGEGDSEKVQNKKI